MIFLDKYNIICDSQFGFRKKSSTLNEIINLETMISRSINSNKICKAIFIDFKKAFDTVNNDILIKKLHHYGIRGLLLLWLNNYLIKIPQFLQFKDEISNEYFSNCGVPQGTVLGPILFLININDIIYKSKLVKLTMFADETTLFLEDNNIVRLQENVNNELVNINNWLISNRLSINLKKTYYMMFNSSNGLDLNIAGININCVKNTTFLGVIIDQKLNLKLEIAAIKTKLYKIIWIFKNVKELFDFKTLILLYNSLILPYLNYCNMIWGNNYNSNINDVYIIQKKIIRIIFNKPKLTNTDTLFIQANILKLPILIKYQTCIFMINIYHNNVSPNSSLFNKKIIPYNTRKRNELYTHFTSTNKCSYTLYIKGPTKWNELNDELKEIKTLNKFKNKLKNYLILNYYILIYSSIFFSINGLVGELCLIRASV